MSDNPTPSRAADPVVAQATTPDGAQPQFIQVIQSPLQPAPIVQGMDESPVEGGYYIVEGQPVDAEGRSVKKRK